MIMITVDDIYQELLRTCYSKLYLTTFNIGNNLIR